YVIIDAKSLDLFTAGLNMEDNPAVPVRRSVTPDYLVCLEDGKKLKMLKRHLRTNYSMTPEEYRAKWQLPADYPMVAPNYAAQRSEFAKKIGLGRRSGKTTH
ncbi:MAG: MucR family transcriptional regulator, partial [Rhodospirillales bacterium]